MAQESQTCSYYVNSARSHDEQLKEWLKSHKHAVTMLTQPGHVDEQQKEWLKSHKHAVTMLTQPGHMMSS